MPSDKHLQLSRTAISWLYSRGCSVFANEVPTHNGIADALGVITRLGDERVYYIEAKVSRSDLICEKQVMVYRRSMGITDRGDKYKWNIYAHPNIGVDYYYLIVADGVKVEPTLYPEWGVLNEAGVVVRRARRIKHEVDSKAHIEGIAHVLVYKHFGKLYL